MARGKRYHPEQRIKTAQEIFEAIEQTYIEARDTLSITGPTVTFITGLVLGLKVAAEHVYTVPNVRTVRGTNVELLMELAQLCQERLKPI